MTTSDDGVPSDRDIIQALAADVVAWKARAEAWAVIEAAIRETHDHWDNDRDSKVGKMLMALGGELPRYRHDIDEARAALAGQQEGE